MKTRKQTARQSELSFKKPWGIFRHKNKRGQLIRVMWNTKGVFRG